MIAPFERAPSASQDHPPTLLIRGANDADVPFEQAKMMVDQFRRHGVPHTLKAIENGEHGLGGGDPQQIKDAYAAMRKFIVRHLDAE